MSDQCSVCRDPMTNDICQTCGVRLCPRHRATWLGEDMRGLWCDACWRVMLEARTFLPTPTRDEALAAMVDCLLRTGLAHYYTPEKTVAGALRGARGGHGCPGGLSYEYGFTVTCRDRKKISVPKDSFVVEKVRGTPCFHVLRYTELDAAVLATLSSPAPAPVQLAMFA